MEDECIICEESVDHLTQGVCHFCACNIQQQSEREESANRCSICFVYDEDTKRGKCPRCTTGARTTADYFRIMLKLPDLLEQMKEERKIYSTILDEDRLEFRRTGYGVKVTLENDKDRDEAASFLMNLGVWVELDTGDIVVIPDQPVPKSGLIGLAQQSS